MSDFGKFMWKEHKGITIPHTVARMVQGAALGGLVSMIPAFDQVPILQDLPYIQDFPGVEFGFEGLPFQEYLDEAALTLGGGALGYLKAQHNINHNKDFMDQLARKRNRGVINYSLPSDRYNDQLQG